MRIAVWHNLPSGGGKRALFDHVRGLVERGHTVEVWCPPTADQNFLPLSALTKEHVVALKPNRNRITDKFGVTLSVENSLSAMNEHCRRCAEQIDSSGFDVLFANTCQLFRTSAIGKYARTPSVLYLQEPFRAMYEAMPRLRWLAPSRSSSFDSTLSILKLKLIDFRMIRNSRVQAREEVDNATWFQKILVNSCFSRESVLRAYGLDSDVCYLGVDSSHFDVEERPRENFVVGLGSFTPEKNVKLCIEALSVLKRPRPKIVWIGNFANACYLADMKLLAESTNVDFEVLINVPDTCVLDILSRAMAMLYAPRLEPFGLAPLEANACGVPVIAVPEGGVRETVIDNLNGVFTEPTAEAMAEKIKYLHDNPKIARELGKNGRAEVIKKWSVSAAVERLERKLESCAA
jgi:glycosyltransferase involved in cell wall biosynthesis